jgi:hypothetical protein
MMLRVTVRTVGHRLVCVVVMTVVVPMRMLVLDRAMLVLMAMRLRQMQHNARQHEGTACRHQAAGRAVAECDGERGTDEWSKRKDRPRTRHSERPLCEQVETQAQQVAGGPDDQECERLANQPRAPARGRGQGQHGRRHHAKCRLGQHDLPRIALRKRPRQGVV